MNRDTQSWMCDFLAGRIGSADPLARGTEIVHIEAHKGRLYAGNGYWMDHPYTAIPWAQVLAIALSPFSEDAGQFLYFGGFDANFLDAHDTAWIYRAHVDTVTE